MFVQIILSYNVHMGGWVIVSNVTSNNISVIS